ncbi:rhodanese-like domain-containing protein [soil metagenome]
MKQLTAPELAAWLADMKAGTASASAPPLLLDVREPWEFERCRIEGALSMPMRSIPERLAELDPAAAIVCICHHGMRSMNAGGYLEQNGFTNITNLTGGIDAWSRLVDPAIPTY